MSALRTMRYDFADASLFIHLQYMEINSDEQKIYTETENKFCIICYVLRAGFTCTTSASMLLLKYCQRKTEVGQNFPEIYRIQT